MSLQEIKHITGGMFIPDKYDADLLSRLDNQNFAVMLNRTGSLKLDSAATAVLDAMIKTETPNILIVCPENRMWEWYAGLFIRLGIEFKYAAEDTIVFVSKTTANLFIAADKPSVCAVPDNYWDLLVIDSAESFDSLVEDSYPNLNDIKAKNLLLFALCFRGYDGFDNGALKLVGRILKRLTKDAQAIFFNIESELNLQIIGYENDRQKLDRLMSELEEIIKSPESCAVIYFREKSTMDAVHSAITGEKRNILGYIKRVTAQGADNAGLYNYLNCKPATHYNIILARDDIMSGFPFTSNISHIINYEGGELCTMFQRFLRRGKNFKINPTFILFENELHLDFYGKELKRALGIVKKNAELYGVSMDGTLKESEVETLMREGVSDCVKIVTDYYIWKRSIKINPVSYDKFLEDLGRGTDNGL
ncbi:MAG: hypothetical protein LBR74_10275 [Eubacterium sp.]|jgi:hypothetical protein|nr:hypothetical protein [Eubacterium sp.]